MQNAFYRSKPAIFINIAPHLNLSYLTKKFFRKWARAARKIFSINHCFSMLFHHFPYPILCVGKIESPPRSIPCVDKIQSPPKHILCVPKTQSPPTGTLCVDKIRSRPSRCYRMCGHAGTAEQLSQNLVRPEDLG